jgi:hypothetical protein
MNIKKLNNSVEMLKEYLGDSLLACDIWMTNTGQSIAGYNTQPKATALFEQVTSFLKKALIVLSLSFNLKSINGACW